MATPRSGDAKKYYRVANQRLEDARFLMRGQRQTAAMYLAGYAVECILKSLLLESTPKKDQGDLAKSFRGPQGHSIISLRDRYVAKGRQIPKAIAKSLILVSVWDVNLRYEPGVIDLRIAQRFLAEVEAICQWVDGRL